MRQISLFTAVAAEGLVTEKSSDIQVLLLLCRSMESYQACTKWYMVSTLLSSFIKSKVYLHGLVNGMMEINSPYLRLSVEVFFFSWADTQINLNGLLLLKGITGNIFS